MRSAHARGNFGSFEFAHGHEVCASDRGTPGASDGGVSGGGKKTLAGDHSDRGRAARRGNKESVVNAKSNPFLGERNRLYSRQETVHSTLDRKRDRGTTLDRRSSLGGAGHCCHGRPDGNGRHGPRL